jgi:hypothetical protein
MPIRNTVDQTVQANALELCNLCKKEAAKIFITVRFMSKQAAL